MLWIELRDGNGRGHDGTQIGEYVLTQGDN